MLIRKYWDTDKTIQAFDLVAIYAYRKSKDLVNEKKRD